MRERGGVIRGKGPQSGTRPRGRWSKDKASAHGTPTLPTELNAANQWAIFNLSAREKTWHTVGSKSLIIPDIFTKKPGNNQKARAFRKKIKESEVKEESSKCRAINHNDILIFMDKIQLLIDILDMISSCDNTSHPPCTVEALSGPFDSRLVHCVRRSITADHSSPQPSDCLTQALPEQSLSTPLT